MMGRDYLIADLEGRGHYVGTVISVTQRPGRLVRRRRRLFLHRRRGGPQPARHRQRRLLQRRLGLPAAQQPLVRTAALAGRKDRRQRRRYRWHVLDPVALQQVAARRPSSTRERRRRSDGFFYLERPDFFSSVAFWYQTGEPKLFGGLPSWSERRVPWRQHHLVRAFRKAHTTGDAKVEVQTQGFFGSRPILAWPNEDVGARLTVPLTVDEDGRYAVRLTAAQGPQYGRYGVYLDDKQLAEGDFRAAEEDEQDLSLGSHVLSRGPHSLSFVALGDPPAGGGSPAAKPLGVEMLRLLKLPPMAARKVKNENEAAFRSPGDRAVALRLSPGLRQAARLAADAGCLGHHAEART